MPTKKKKVANKAVGVSKDRREESCCTTSKTTTPWCLYGLGFVGALVYYISTATGFWMGVWGVIKALLWPAFLVYSIMQYLGM